MHVFCSYFCAVKREIVPKATTFVVSFLDMLSPGIDALTWNPRDSMYPWMFSFILMRSPHIFLNLINQPRGRMVMEMYCGLLLFINSNLILLQLILRISLTLQVSSLAQLLSFPVAFSDSGSLSQVRRSSLFSYPVEGFLSYLMNRFPQNIELTSCQFNLLMNLNHLLKPSIILAGDMLCRKKEMPKRIRLSFIAWRERSHWLQVDLQDQA